MVEEDANSSAPPAKVKRAVQVAIEILVLAYLAYYFSTQGDKLQRVLSVRWIDAASLIGLGLAAAALRSWQLKYLVGTLGGRIPYVEAASLTMGCTLLNYLPMNAGMIVKARALKKHVGVQYAHFASLMMGQVLATVVGGAVLGLGALAVSWNAVGAGRWYVAGIFAAAMVGCLVAFHIPASSVPAGKGWLRTVLRDFLAGLGHIRRRPAGLGLLVLLADGQLLLLGWRFWICFRVLGVEATYLGCVVLAVVTGFLMLVTITPASLGVREVLVGAVAAITALSFEVGLLAAGIDRVFSMVMHLCTGLAGLALLRARKKL